MNMREHRVTDVMGGKEIVAYRIDNDMYGNPRYIVHYRDVAKTYEEALVISRIIGGKKYRGKQFAGGIVFQSYSLTDDLRTLLNK